MAIPATPSTTSPLYGAGNARISAEQIKAYINAPGRTAAEIQSVAQANGVSVEQISRAMSGNAAFSEQSIHSYLASQGIQPLATQSAAPFDPAAAAATLYGAGNADISDAEIQDFLNQPGRTAEQVLAGALANGISAAQIARAMAGHSDLSLEHVNHYLADQGITPTTVHADPLDFRAEILFGAGNPNISAEQIQDFVFQSGVTSEHILAAAIEHGISAEQLAAALPDRAEFSLDNITNYIASQGIATQRDPSRTANLQGSVLYGQGNAEISDAEIQAYINAAGRTEDQILHAALANGVSLAQIAHAMDGQPAFTLDNLNDVVGFKQDTSRLEVLLVEQAQLLKELDSASGTQATDAASQAAMDALRASLAQLEPQLEAARAKVDERIAQGQAQDAVAAQAENAAAALKAQFDPLQLERLHAQAQIDEQQAAVDAAQLEVNAAQAALDTANQDIAAAAGIKKKSRRHRARGEAQAMAAAAQTALTAAQQKLAGVQPGLAQAQAAAAPAFAAAQAMQLQWQAAQETANAQRAQANVLLGSAQRACQLEVALKQALSGDELQLIQRSQDKATALQAQIDAGKLQGTARSVALKSLALDTQEAAELVQRIDAQTAEDRLRESALAQAAVPLQTQAAGAALIAQNLISDAAQFDQAQTEVQAQLGQAKSDLQSAAARLLAAKTALAKADFAVDWDQAKKDAAKSSQAVAIDQPQLDAAQAELDAAQAAFDESTAKLSRLQHLASPLGAATLEADYAAGSAVQRATTAAHQASAALGWAELAQARYQSSDQLLAVNQYGLIQSTEGLGLVQSAAAQSDPALAAQAQRTQAWAQQVAQQVSNARGAAETTRAEQSTQNQLAIQAGAAQILSVFLKDKVTRASEVYAQAQAALSVNQEDFQNATTAAGALAPAAEAARQELSRTEADAAFAFALGRSKLSPEQLKEAQADPAGFVQHWQEQEMAGRKTERKQIHLLDDLAQYQNADPAVQAARQHVLDTAGALSQASQAAIDAGDTAQASLIVTGLLGQTVLGDQTQLAQANASAADLGAQVGAHALVLGQAAQHEVLAQQHAGHADGATAELAGQIAAQMPQSATDWNQASAAWKAQAASEASALQTLTAQIGQDEAARSELQTQLQTSAAEVEQLHGFAGAVLKEVADRDEHIGEMHRDRQLMDEAHKRAKKGGLLKILMMVGITIAAAAVTFFSAGTLSEVAAEMEFLAYGALFAEEVVEGAAVAAEIAEGAGAAGTLAEDIGAGLMEFNPAVLEGEGAVAEGAAAEGAAEGSAETVAEGAAKKPPLEPKTWWGHAVKWGGAGLAGNLTQQGLSLAAGVQDKFSWKELGLSTFSAAATGGLFHVVGGAMSQAMLNGFVGIGAVDAVSATAARTLSQEIAGHVAQGVTATAINSAVQGSMIGIGLQDSYNWSQAAAMGITAGLSSATNESFTAALSKLKLTPFEEQLLRALNSTALNGAGFAGSAGGKVNIATLQQAIDFGASGGQGGASHAPEGTPGHFHLDQNLGFKSSNPFDVQVANQGPLLHLGQVTDHLSGHLANGLNPPPVAGGLVDALGGALREAGSTVQKGFNQIVQTGAAVGAGIGAPLSHAAETLVKSGSPGVEAPVAGTSVLETVKTSLGHAVTRTQQEIGGAIESGQQTLTGVADAISGTVRLGGMEVKAAPGEIIRVSAQSRSSLGLSDVSPDYPGALLTGNTVYRIDQPGAENRVLLVTAAGDTYLMPSHLLADDATRSVAEHLADAPRLANETIRSGLHQAITAGNRLVDTLTPAKNAGQITPINIEDLPTTGWRQVDGAAGLVKPGETLYQHSDGQFVLETPEGWLAVPGQAAQKYLPAALNEPELNIGRVFNSAATEAGTALKDAGGMVADGVVDLARNAAQITTAGWNQVTKLANVVKEPFSSRDESGGGQSDSQGGRGNQERQGEDKNRNQPFALETEQGLMEQGLTPSRPLSSSPTENEVPGMSGSEPGVFGGPRFEQIARTGKVPIRDILANDGSLLTVQAATQPIRLAASERYIFVDVSKVDAPPTGADGIAGPRADLPSSPPDIRASLVPLPPRKPTRSDRLARLEVANILSKPNTPQEQITQILWFQSDNPSVSPQDIRASVHDIFNETKDFRDIVKEQIRHNVPAAQLIEAVDGTHEIITRSYIEDHLAKLGFPSPDKWLQSIDESTVVQTRLKLNELGLGHLDGSGVKVWAVESHEHVHGDLVSAMINDPKFGLAPGAIVEIKHILTVPEIKQHADIAMFDFHENLEGIINRITVNLDNGATRAELTNQLNAELALLVSTHLRSIDKIITSQVRDFTESDAQVLNLSVGSNLPLILERYQEAVEHIVNLSPKLAHAIAPSSSTLDTYFLKDDISPLVLSAMVSGFDSPVQAAYVEATKAAADKGKIIIVSAGNMQEVAREFVQHTGVELPVAMTLSPYVRSDYVIAVGASKTNGTPLVVSDDTVAEFSSHGGGGYGVTTITQGDNVAVPYRLFIASGGRVRGTSVSAPTVGGLAALYKQVSPRSGLGEFKDLLTRHSVDTAAPAAAEGAGMLDLLGAALDLGSVRGLSDTTSLRVPSDDELPREGAGDRTLELQIAHIDHVNRSLEINASGDGQNQGKDSSDRVVEAQIAQLDLISESLEVNDSTNAAKIRLAHNEHELIKSDSLPVAGLSTPLPTSKPNPAARLKRLSEIAVARLRDRVGSPTLVNPNIQREQITQTLWLQPHNAELTHEAIRARVFEIFNQTHDFRDILIEQVAHDMPVAQLIEAVDGHHPILTRSYIEDQLASMGFHSPDKWLRSVDESTVMHTRLALDQQGLAHLDGSGVKVWVLEPYNQTHDDLVATVIDDPMFGLAPGAAVEKIYIAEQSAPMQHPDHVVEGFKNDLQEAIGRLAVRLDNGATRTELADQLTAELALMISANSGLLKEKFVKEVKNFAASDAQVLNLSYSVGIPLVLSALGDIAYEIVDRSPKLVQALFPGTSLHDYALIGQKIAPLYLSAWSQALNSPLQKAYVEATKAAADKGKIILVAAGNAQEAAREYKHDTGMDLPDSLTINPYGMSDHVIVVGASKNNGTPLDVSDDTMAEFSSHGGARYKVTTTTQGDNVAVPYRLFVASGGAVRGTSFSAPTAGGLAVLYKQVNPKGSLANFKDLLTRHSVNTGAPDAAEGAGMLDVLGAALDLGSAHGLNDTRGRRGRGADRTAVPGPRSSVDPKTNSSFDESMPMEDGRSGFALNEQSANHVEAPSLSGGAGAVEPARTLVSLEAANSTSLKALDDTQVATRYMAEAMYLAAGAAEQVMTDAVLPDSISIPEITKIYPKIKLPEFDLGSNYYFANNREYLNNILLYVNSIPDGAKLLERINNLPNGARYFSVNGDFKNHPRFPEAKKNMIGTVVKPIPEPDGFFGKAKGIERYDDPIVDIYIKAPKDNTKFDPIDINDHEAATLITYMHHENAHGASLEFDFPHGLEEVQAYAHGDGIYAQIMSGASNFDKFKFQGPLYMHSEGMLDASDRIVQKQWNDLALAQNEQFLPRWQQLGLVLFDDGGGKSTLLHTLQLFDRRSDKARNISGTNDPANNTNSLVRRDLIRKFDLSQGDGETINNTFVGDASPGNSKQFVSEVAPIENKINLHGIDIVEKISISAKDRREFVDDLIDIHGGSGKVDRRELMFRSMAAVKQELDSGRFTKNDVRELVKGLDLETPLRIFFEDLLGEPPIAPPVTAPSVRGSNDASGLPTMYLEKSARAGAAAPGGRMADSHAALDNYNSNPIRFAAAETGIRSDAGLEGIWQGDLDVDSDSMVPLPINVEEEINAIITSHEQAQSFKTDDSVLWEMTETAHPHDQNTQQEYSTFLSEVPAGERADFENAVRRLSETEAGMVLLKRVFKAGFPVRSASETAAHPGGMAGTDDVYVASVARKLSNVLLAGAAEKFVRDVTAARKAGKLSETTAAEFIESSNRTTEEHLTFIENLVRQEALDLEKIDLGHRSDQAFSLEDVFNEIRRVAEIGAGGNSSYRDIQVHGKIDEATLELLERGEFPFGTKEQPVIYRFVDGVPEFEIALPNQAKLILQEEYFNVLMQDKPEGVFVEIEQADGEPVISSPDEFIQGFLNLHRLMNSEGALENGAPATQSDGKPFLGGIRLAANDTDVVRSDAPKYQLGMPKPKTNEISLEPKSLAQAVAALTGANGDPVGSIVGPRIVDDVGRRAGQRSPILNIYASNARTVVSNRDRHAHVGELPTTLNAFMSAANGYGNGAASALGSMAQSQVESGFSLAEAAYYPISNWISDGTAEQVANAPDAPEHVLRAKASYEATKDFVSNLSPANAISGALDFAAAKIEAVKNLELPLDRLMAQWLGARTEEDWHTVGNQAALFSVAVAGIILPNGKMRNGAYEVDGEIWPKSGTQQTAYRDGDVVYKHANEVVTFNAGGPDEKILALSVPERIILKNEIVTHQNRFGSHLPAGVFPKATELDGIWMRQNYIGGKVPNGLGRSEEAAFLADRDVYINMVMNSISIKHKSTFQMFDDNSGFVYRVGNTLVASDWDRRNLRFLDGKTYWFDPAMVWPLELLNKKK